MVIKLECCANANAQLVKLLGTSPATTLLIKADDDFVSLDPLVTTETGTYALGHLPFPSLKTFNYGQSASLTTSEHEKR
jgi:hypothetical protein